MTKVGALAQAPNEILAEAVVSGGYLGTVDGVPFYYDATLANDEMAIYQNQDANFQYTTHTHRAGMTLFPQDA